MTVSQFDVEAIVYRYVTAQLMIKMIFLEINLLLTPSMTSVKSQTTAAAQKT